MKWPSKNKPELHQRGKVFVVRWYDPVSKQARSIRTKSEVYAKAMHRLMGVNDERT